MIGFVNSAFVALAGAIALGGGADVATKRPPNVIVVMTDDQGYGDLACLGHPALVTPNLDALHAQSVRLTDYHVDPTCSPTRSALMTGRYSSRTGVWHTIMGRSILRRDEVTMADVFSASGYRTAIFGKWHLGDNFPHRPQDRGFERVLIHGGGGVGQTPDYWGNDYFDDTYFDDGKPRKFTGYCTDVWFNGALKFIEANRDRPFFAYLVTNAPHSPFNVAEKYSKPYRNNPNVPNANFHGMIANIDENMGRLTQKLEALGLEDDTILIFTTDNGTAAGVQLDRQGFVKRGYNAAMRGKKGSVYEGGHRVPCFIRWPNGGLTGGRDVDQLTAHIDLLPTLIDLCGLKQPANVKFDGASLGGLLRGKGGDWPDRTLFVHSQRIDHPEKWRQIAVMTERWRLINGKELYDIKEDPGQKSDLAGRQGNVVAGLRQAYDRWWADLSTRFDAYCEIVLGSDLENPVQLTCHDWHGAKVPWNQGAIRNAMIANGFWAVEVARAGRYEITLRRWPPEVSRPINARAAGGLARQARLVIASVDETKPVAADAESVTFQVCLDPGKTRLQTWFTNDEGVARGAYYVQAKRLP